MYDICLKAATSNQKYGDNMLKTGSKYLCATIRGDYYWSSSLTNVASRRTQIKRLPGQNKMGVILMQVRDELRTPAAQEGWEMAHNKKHSNSQQSQSTTKPENIESYDSAMHSQVLQSESTHQ